jgi:hypothetical protein
MHEYRQATNWSGDPSLLGRYNRYTRASDQFAVSPAQLRPRMKFWPPCSPGRPLQLRGPGALLPRRYLNGLISQLHEWADLRGTNIVGPRLFLCVLCVSVDSVSNFGFENRPCERVMCLEKINPIGRLYRHSPLFRMQWQLFSLAVSETSILPFSRSVSRTRPLSKCCHRERARLGEGPCKTYLRARDLLFSALGSNARMRD